MKGIDAKWVFYLGILITLEQAIDYIADDELVEVTPNFIRLRKIYLTEYI